MRQHTVMLALTALLLIPGTGFATETESEKNLFFIVTTDNEMNQLMSMVLATQSMSKGATVDVLLCGKAGDLVIQGSPETKLKPKNVSPQMLLKNLIGKGVDVEVCPLYLPNTNQTQDDLIKGVKVAQPSQVADKLLRENTSILTY